MRVLKGRSRVGGRTAALEAEGFRFDTGPTFFLFPLARRRNFAVIGRDLDDEVPMVRLDPQYHLIFGAGGELRATPNVSKMVEQVARLSLRDAQQLRRYLLTAARPMRQRQVAFWTCVAEFRPAARGCRN